MDNAPASDEISDFIDQFEDRLDIADDMLMSATGWTAQSLLNNAEDEGMTVAEYIAQEIDEDNSCPFEETRGALESYIREGDNWNVYREVTNELFDLMFGQTAEDMLITIAQAVNKRLPTNQNEKSDDKAPTL